ncbi:hypothetical protein IW150_005410 [Coemansia sp. RSA 2607]|nr:hypothetical protein IW150_005410 [Coemansia sp. RSA 2607]
MGVIVLAPSAAIGAVLLGSLFYSKSIRRRKKRTKNPSGDQAFISSDEELNQDLPGSNLQDKYDKNTRPISVLSVSSCVYKYDRPEDSSQVQSDNRTSRQDLEMLQQRGFPVTVNKEDEDKDQVVQVQVPEQTAQVTRREVPGRSGLRSDQHGLPGTHIPPTNAMEQQQQQQQQHQQQQQQHQQQQQQQHQHYMNAMAQMHYAYGPPQLYPIPMHPGYVNEYNQMQSPVQYVQQPPVQCVQQPPVQYVQQQPAQLNLEQREAELAKREAEMKEWMRERDQRRRTVIVRGTQPQTAPNDVLLENMYIDSENPKDAPPSYNDLENINNH